MLFSYLAFAPIVSAGRITARVALCNPAPLPDTPFERTPMNHDLKTMHYHRAPGEATLPSVAALFPAPLYKDSDPLRGGLELLGFEPHHADDCPHCRDGCDQGLAAGPDTPSPSSADCAALVADLMGPVSLLVQPSAIGLLALVALSLGAATAEARTQRSQFESSLGGSI